MPGERRPTGGHALARVANAVVVLALSGGAVAAAVAGSVVVGAALGALAVVLLPGVAYPRYNLVAVAVDLAIRYP
jgi:hypothetical protein